MAPASPDDMLDVVVDIGEEQIVHIPKRGIKSANAVRIAIAKASVDALGERAPKAWQKAARNNSSNGLHESMNVTLSFDNQVDEPVSYALTGKTKVERIREATSLFVMPT